MKSKRERLVEAGYRVGDVKELLGLDDEDMVEVERLRAVLRNEKKQDEVEDLGSS